MLRYFTPLICGKPILLQPNIDSVNLIETYDVGFDVNDWLNLTHMVPVFGMQATVKPIQWDTDSILILKWIWMVLWHPFTFLAHSITWHRALVI